MENKLYLLMADKQLDPQEYQQMFQLLSPERQERLRRISSKNAKQLSLLGDILTRILLCEHFNLSNKQLSIDIGNHGKPFLSGYPNAHFNISHSADAVLCGICNTPIGVDIEKIKPANLAIAKRFFTFEECEYIQEDPKTANERFIFLWTRKESYIKWAGGGLSIPLNSFDVLKVQREVAFYSEKLDGYLLSVCAKFPPQEIHRLDMDGLRERMEILK